MEFSAVDGGMEAWPGAGDRLYRRFETGRTNTAIPGLAKQQEPPSPRTNKSTRSRLLARQKLAN